MDQAARILVAINFVLLTLHEMDAVHWKEWRLFGIKDDAAGRVVFILAHVPLYLLLLGSLVYLDTLFGRIASIAMGAFLVVHFFLHRAKFAAEYFRELFSSAVIIVMAVASVFQLVITSLLILT